MATAGRKPGTAKTGGRKRGTPNRKAADLATRIEKALGGDPVEKMASLAKDVLDSDSIELKVHVVPLLKEIATYHSPRRKPVEGSVRSPIKLPVEPAERAEAIMTAASGGSISLGEAQILMSLEGSRQQAVEHSELIDRIEKLEAAT